MAVADIAFPPTPAARRVDHLEVVPRAYSSPGHPDTSVPVVPELLEAGHEVVGLARSDRSAAALGDAGTQAHRGSLDDLAALRDAAAAADGVIHLAFEHEAMRAGDFAGAVAADLRVVETFGDALAGTGKSLVTASGTLMLALAGAGTRRDRS